MLVFSIPDAKTASKEWADREAKAAAVRAAKQREIEEADDVFIVILNKKRSTLFFRLD